MSASALVLALGLSAGDPATPESFDALWPQRDQPEAAETLARAAALFAASADYDELWRAASWYVWVASDDQKGSNLRAAALSGRVAGERALQIDPSGVEALYWTALSVGLYASMSGPFEALAAGIDKHFRDPLLTVSQADPGHENPRLEYVGADIALGALFQHLPWPGQDRTRARALLERAVRARPENLRAHYMLADFLRDVDRDAARRELELVRDGDAAYDPPDARRQKRKAVALLERLR